MTQQPHPEMQGDLPLPSHVHSTTLIRRKVVIFGGGEVALCCNSAFIFDILTCRWSYPMCTTFSHRATHTQLSSTKTNPGGSAVEAGYRC